MFTFVPSFFEPSLSIEHPVYICPHTVLYVCTPDPTMYYVSYPKPGECTSALTMYVMCTSAPSHHVNICPHSVLCTHVFTAFCVSLPNLSPVYICLCPCLCLSASIPYFESVRHIYLRCPALHTSATTPSCGYFPKPHSYVLPPLHPRYLSLPTTCSPTPTCPAYLCPGHSCVYLPKTYPI